MMDLKFRVDKHHLAYKYVLKYFADPNAPTEWLNLKKSLANQHSAYPGFLFFEPAEIGHGLLWSDTQSPRYSVIRDEETVQRIFETIFESEIFKQVLAATEKYRNDLEQIWEKHTTFREEYAGIIRLETSVSAETLVLSPELETGSYISNNIIEWGNPDLFENYQFIGLCHEFLHILTEKQFLESKTEEDKWLLHALIYLSADEELRVRMNGGEYFASGSVDKYHPRLIETAQKYLPAWRTYITAAKGSILDLYEELRAE